MWFVSKLFHRVLFYCVLVEMEDMTSTEVVNWSVVIRSGLGGVTTVRTLNKVGMLVSWAPSSAA